jgi:glycosyltransferase involved in cell wall biosynthesis
MSVLISIIIPSYNRANFIGETLQSVLDQTYQHWECIVVDDGSTDDSVALVSAFSKGDNRIQLYMRGESYLSGGNGARQMGLDFAQGEWVQFLDADDLLQPFCVEQRLKLLDDSYDMHLYPTGIFTTTIGDNKIIWNQLVIGEGNQELLLRFLCQDMPWHTGSVLWRKEFLQHIGGWNQELEVWQDWELHVRALLNKPLIRILDTEPDTFYRLHVINSKASKRYKLSYLEGLTRSISYIEPLMNSTIQSPQIREALRFLIFRNCVGNPIRWKKYELFWNYLRLNLRFTTVSKTALIIMFFKYYIASITILKKRFKSTWKIYKKMYPNTTFLKTKSHYNG